MSALFIGSITAYQIYCYYITYKHVKEKDLDQCFIIPKTFVDNSQNTSNVMLHDMSTSPITVKQNITFVDNSQNTSNVMLHDMSTSPITANFKSNSFKSLEHEDYVNVVKSPSKSYVVPVINFVTNYLKLNNN